MSLANLTEDLNRPRNNTLQAAIANKTEEFVEILANRTSEIQQLNGQGLASFGENIRTIMLHPEYTKLETADRCKDVANEGAERLAQIVQIKPFPIGQRVEEAASGLVGGLERLLAATVPNVTDQDANSVIPTLPSQAELESLTPRLSDDDLKDLQEQRNEAKLVVKTSKNEATKKAMPTVENAVSKIHDSLLAAVITGQEGKEVKRGDLALKAVKGLPGDFAAKPIAAQDFGVDLSSLNSSTSNKSQSFDVKATVFDKNPYTWSDTAEQISTPVLKLDLTADNGTKVSTPVQIRLKHKPAAFTRYNRRDMAKGGDSGMVYHVMVLRHEKEVVQLFLRVPKLLTSLTVYLRSGKGPSKDYFDVKEAVDSEVFKDKLQFKVFVDSGGKLKKGLVYVGLLMTSGGQLPVNGSATANGTDLTEDTTEATTIAQGLGRRRRSVDNNTLLNTTTTTTSPPEADEEAEEAEEDDLYDFKAVTDSCQVWDPDSESWEATSCTVSPFSSDEETICDCPRPPGNTFASSFSVVPNTIDFSIVFTKFDITNASVYGTMIAFLVIYALLMVYARRQDNKDRERWRVGFLKDNSAHDRYFYLLKVYTGLRKSSGTKSNIGFVLGGELADTGVRILSDGERTPETGSVLNLVMATEQPLGDLSYLRIWHDNSGYAQEASWFLSKVVVEDLQRHRRYLFNCDQWLALDKEDSLVDRVLPVCSSEAFTSFNTLFTQHAQLNMTDMHLWVSVFMRPDRSSFTRCQRVTCCLALLFLTMITSAMFFKTEKEKEKTNVSTTFSIGIFHFSMTSVFISTVSILITLPPSLLLVYLFKSSRPIPKRYRLGTLFGRVGKKKPGEATPPKPVSALNDIMDRQEDRNPLPWGCVYLGWVVAFVAVATSAFYLLLFSMMWGKLKSEEWVTSFFLSFIESIFVLDPIKVVILAVLLALCLRRSPYDKDNHLDVGDVAKEARQHSKDGTRFDMTMLPPEPVPEALLEAARKRKKQELQAQAVFWEVVMYVVFLFVLFIIAFGNRDEYFYQMKDSMESALYYVSRTGFNETKTRGDLFTWTKTTFLNTLYPMMDYRGKRLKYRERLFFSDSVNFRVGPPSLRQMRMSKTSPPPPPPSFYKAEKLLENRSYVSGYDHSAEETRDFCLRWKEPPCPPGEDRKAYTSSAWKYMSPDEAWTFPLFTDFGTYGGGGYLADLSIQRTKALLRLEELEREGWLDRRTRMVVVEFTLFNPNNRVFLNVKLCAEFAETGSAFLHSTIQPFQVYGHSGAKGAFLVLAEVVALLVFLWLMGRTAVALVKHRLAFFHQFWLVLDLVISLFSIACVSLLTVREVFSQRLMAGFTSEPKVFVNFQQLIFWDGAFVAMLGFLLFASLIRALRILGYNQRVIIIASVLRHSARSLCGFAIVFSVVFLAFGLAGYILFTGDEDYRSLESSLMTMFVYMLVRGPLGRVIVIGDTTNKIFLLALVFFIIFVLFTMFQAIVNNSMAVVRMDLNRIPSPYGLVDVLVNMYRSVIGDWLPSSLFHKTKTLPGGRKASLKQSGDTYRVLSGLRAHMDKVLEDEGKPEQKPGTPKTEGKFNWGFEDDEGRSSALSTKNISLSNPTPHPWPASPPVGPKGH